MNDFELLGVATGADPDVVKKAWRAKVKSSHPDIAADSKAATAELAIINAAYDRIKSGKPQMTRTDPGSARPGRSSGSRPAYEDFSTGPHDRTAPGADRAGRNAHRAEAKGPGQAGSAYRRDNPDQTQYSRGPEAQARYSRAAEAARQKFQREEVARATQKRTQERPAPKQEQAGPDRSAESDIVFNANTRKGLDDFLETVKRREAMKRVMETRGAYPDPRGPIDTDRGDLPGFHAGTRLSIKDGVLRLHVGTHMKDGRNLVAMPDLSVSGGDTLRQGRQPRLVEIDGKATDRAVRIDSSKIPGAPKDFAFEVHFGDERSRDRSNDRSR